MTATPEQMQAELTRQRAEIVELKGVNVTAQTAIAALQAAVSAAEATANAARLEFLEKLSQLQSAMIDLHSRGTEKTQLLIDAKGIGKPSVFDSTDHRRFPTWRS